MFRSVGQRNRPHRPIQIPPQEGRPSDNTVRTLTLKQHASGVSYELAAANARRKLAESNFFLLYVEMLAIHGRLKLAMSDVS